MNGALRHPVRVGVRLLRLAGIIIYSLLRFPFEVYTRPPQSRRLARAGWLQAVCRRALRLFNMEVRVSGHAPQSGLLVSNHLGYLDILALGALMPSIFVAKSEVRCWPVFGWFARLGGALFTQRHRKTNVRIAAGQLRDALEDGGLVVLFPEGTSSDGRSVLPFKSSLLQPAMDVCAPLSTSVINYELLDGDVSEEVCYWKDMTLVPHLLNLLSRRRLSAVIRFQAVEAEGRARKELAVALRSSMQLRLPGALR
jgi:1-acyl-sn-glycerol-3-phosphate acyltransferase